MFARAKHRKWLDAFWASLLACATAESSLLAWSYPSCFFLQHTQQSPSVSTAAAVPFIQVILEYSKFHFIKYMAGDTQFIPSRCWGLFSTGTANLSPKEAFAINTLFFTAQQLFSTYSLSLSLSLRIPGILTEGQLFTSDTVITDCKVLTGTRHWVLGVLDGAGWVMWEQRFWTWSDACEMAFSKNKAVQVDQCTLA